jgi:hypothetical protein
MRDQLRLVWAARRFTVTQGGNQGGGAVGDRTGGRARARAAKVRAGERLNARDACACHMQQHCRWHVAGSARECWSAHGRPRGSAVRLISLSLTLSRLCNQ